MSKTVFFYGSLKRGHYNYKRFGMDECKFLGSAEIWGYKLFTNVMYPAVINSGDDNDIVYGEVFLVPDELFQLLKQMEIGAGYHIDTVDAVWDAEKQVTVELFAMNLPQVERRWEFISDGVFKLN